MLHAAYGSTAAYSVPTSRRGVVTIVDAAQQQEAPPTTTTTLSLLDNDERQPGADAGAADAATVLALGPHVVARGSGPRVVYKVWRPPPQMSEPHNQPPQQWAMDYEGPVRQVMLIICGGFNRTPNQANLTELQNI